ncbi:hypothetical protein PhCBS80983_g04917 [Powellomyces hirtus]|uniref:RING-CH-type domain-containing protein n=1 Tax=Powellomyces hirtus TaxID=109895 RepID=A0A507DWQ1_9FUNG|nr:hypothetical protein PhCBS80983_g04917 [Powellomyces hirtus]
MPQNLYPPSVLATVAALPPVPARPYPKMASSTQPPLRLSTTLNNNNNNANSHSTMTPPTASSAESLAVAAAPVAWEDSTGDEKRCWICFLEEGEEPAPPITTNYQQQQQQQQQQSQRTATSPPPPIWVRPCKCKNSLKYAHETCLLRWITEKQGPLTPDVRCPACGHTYVLAESRDVLLSALTLVDKTVAAVVPYVTLAGVSLAFYIVSTTYGAYAVMTMCGPDVGERVLSENNWGWRTWVGLPMIPISLICSRLTAADAALPLLPFLVLGNDHIRLSFPPSPALTVCILPWARLAYNAVWDKLAPLVDRFFTRKARKQGLEGGMSGGAEQVEDPPVEDGEEEYPLARRDGQRLVLGSLFLPAASQLMGTLLGTLPYLRHRLPSDAFHRNVLGGALLVLCKDMSTAVYRAHRKRQRRTRRVLDYRGD